MPDDSLVIVFDDETIHVNDNTTADDIEESPRRQALTASHNSRQIYGKE